MPCKRHVSQARQPDVQRPFWRTGFTEQSTLARTLYACMADTVAQIECVAWYYRGRSAG